jgi:hypothetical protein
MIGITLTTDQIRTAPAPVRQWIEQQVIAGLGLAAETPVSEQPHASHLVACSEEDAAGLLAQIQNFLPAVNVLFEFGRPGITYGRPPMMAFRLIDILHHSRLQNVGQVMTCLDAINQALTTLRGDAGARFCVFDNEGHCFVAPQTQQSILHLWQGVIASRQAAADGISPGPLAPAAGNHDTPAATAAPVES